MTQGEAVVRIERSGPVAEVVLCRPEKRNAMGPAFWTELPAAFEAIGEDDGVRVAMVRAEGPTFSAGLDLEAFAVLAQDLFGGTARKRAHLLAEIERMQAAISAIERCPKPVVACVHGACVGGGVELISACCIRLASADATFSLKEARLAIVADLGALKRLPRAIGLSRSLELAYTGRTVDAAWAHEAGLVSRVLPDRDALWKAGRELCAAIAQNPPIVVQAIKRLSLRGLERSTDDALREVAMWQAAFLESDDLMEAISAQFERRAPEFKGS